MSHSKKYIYFCDWCFCKKKKNNFINEQEKLQFGKVVVYLKNIETGRFDCTFVSIVVSASSEIKFVGMMEDSLIIVSKRMALCPKAY